MTNAYLSFLTHQISGGQNASATGKTTAGHNGLKASLSGEGATSQSGAAQSDFFEMIAERIELARQNAGGNPRQANNKNLQGLIGSLNDGDGDQFTTMGLGNLSQETLAQLAAQFQSGEGANELSLPQGLMKKLMPEGEISLQSLFGVQTPPGQSGDELLQQINQILQQGNLQTTDPDLHSRLTALQNALSEKIANGEMIQPGGEIDTLAAELNLFLAQNNVSNQTIGQDSIANLQSRIQAFLTAPQATQDIQTQLRPDVLTFLNGQNFAGFQSRGKLFGSLQNTGNGGGTNMNALAAQLNAMEPGAQNSSSQNTNFAQLLQNFSQNMSGGASAFGLNSGSIFGSESNDLNFSGHQQSAENAQQQQILANTNPLGLQSATNVAVQAPAAGSSHPASQIIAAHIAKNAAANKPHMMTLHLNPPELGRVHVSLELSRDNSLKARITTEKSDTHAMLQRDSDSLQRALEQAGVDLSEGGLEFELADGDNAFDDFLKDNGSGEFAGSGNNNSDEQEIIESQMDIEVDPDTGIIHVNMLA